MNSIKYHLLISRKVPPVSFDIFSSKPVSMKNKRYKWVTSINHYSLRIIKGFQIKNEFYKISIINFSESPPSDSFYIFSLKPVCVKNNQYEWLTCKHYQSVFTIFTVYDSRSRACCVLFQINIAPFWGEIYALRLF